MKQQWVNPELTDLSIAKTEAAIESNPVHDGAFYDTQYGKFEGHQS